MGMDRIQRSWVQGKIDAANRLLGFDPDQCSWNTVGAIHLSSAYGGWRVDRVSNESGGVTSLSEGYQTMRHCHTFMQGFLAALYIKKDEK